jgi:hypothetical protein
VTTAAAKKKKKKKKESTTTTTKTATAELCPCLHRLGGKLSGAGDDEESSREKEKDEFVRTEAAAAAGKKTKRRNSLAAAAATGASTKRARPAETGPAAFRVPAATLERAASLTLVLCEEKGAQPQEAEQTRGRE